MSGPRTEAGRRLAAVPLIDGDDDPLDLTDDILAIEAEAIATERARIAPVLRVARSQFSTINPGHLRGCTRIPCVCPEEVRDGSLLALIDPATPTPEAE